MASIIFLREKCVDVRLLSISCSVVLLHRLAFNDVPQSRFQSKNLGDPQKLRGFALFKMSSQVSHARIIFQSENCVGVRLLSITCSFVLLHRLAFSDVPQWLFQSRFQSSKGARFRSL